MTVSKDGYLRIFFYDKDLENGSQKQFFIAQGGLTAGCVLSEELVALAGNNLNIYIFNYQKGSTIEYLYAHDDLITEMLFCNDTLLTVSKDYVTKVWKFTVPHPNYHHNARNSS